MSFLHCSYDCHWFNYRFYNKKKSWSSNIVYHKKFTNKLEIKYLISRKMISKQINRIIHSFYCISLEFRVWTDRYNKNHQIVRIESFECCNVVYLVDYPELKKRSCNKNSWTQHFVFVNKYRTCKYLLTMILRNCQNENWKSLFILFYIFFSLLVVVAIAFCGKNKKIKIEESFRMVNN